MGTAHVGQVRKQHGRHPESEEISGRERSAAGYDHDESAGDGPDRGRQPAPAEAGEQRRQRREEQERRAEQRRAARGRIEQQRGCEAAAEADEEADGHVLSCPAAAVRDEACRRLAVPTYRQWSAGAAPAAPLLDHIRQQSDEPGALDRLGELALLLGGHRRDAARHDLAALGDVAAEQPHVLVVDLRRLIARERAGLAPAMERAARRDGGDLGHGSALLRRGGRGRFALARRTRAARPVSVAALAVAAEAAASAATEAAAATTVAAEASAVTAAEAATVAPEAAAIAVAAVVTVALAHLDGRLGLVRLHPHREEADDVRGEAHAPLHLGHGGRRSVDIHERVVGLAVLLDLEGDGLETPILGLADFAAAFLDDLGVFLRQRLDLGLADVLARQEHVLVERHCVAFPSVCMSDPAQSPFWARDSSSCTERPKGPERAETPGDGRLALPHMLPRAASRSASGRSG